jgi:protoheme IX farnesyltransferase
MKTYYRLAKPGIVYGNAMTALAAFVFASARHIDVPLLVAMLIGISFTIAGSCVLNNIIDRDIDARMERTKARAMVTGDVSIPRALAFGILLIALGFASLLLFTNFLTFLVALFGVVIYVGVYTPLKRRTIHSTIVGALAGAVPPVVGYTAVTNAFDTTALLLFLILVCWQMVHFFAIAIFRLEDYRAAGIPVMPVRLGVARTKALMVVYAFLFSFAALALYVSDNLGALYGWTLGLLSLGWIVLSIIGFRAQNDARWARRLFFYSIIVLLLFCIALALS